MSQHKPNDSKQKNNVIVQNTEDKVQLNLGRKEQGKEGEDHDWHLWQKIHGIEVSSAPLSVWEGKQFQSGTRNNQSGGTEEKKKKFKDKND